MDSQQQEPRPPSDRPSFFGRPASWIVWSQLGRQFWAGVVVGIGIGFLVAAVLVELELLTLQSKLWVAMTGIALVAIGQAITFRVVRRSRQPKRISRRTRYQGCVRIGDIRGFGA